MPDRRKLRKSLQTILSEERVLLKEAVPARYRFDALGPYRPYPGLRLRGYAPTLLVRPETSDEIQAILHVVAQFRVPVVTYGGGTGLMGAAIAAHGGVMVDTSRMKRIDAISREDMMFTAQPGVVLEDAYTRLDEEQLLFAHDPWTRPIATIGGAISTNSLGYLGAKYGSMGSQLLGLETVLPNGKLLKTRPAQFSSTGFDLRRLFIGTEGLYGIVTSAVIRAFPTPETLELASYGFQSFEAAHRAITMLRVNDVRPTMLDYGEEPASKEESQLNLAFDGTKEETVAQSARAQRVLTENGARKLDNSEAVEFWEHRHDIALMFSRRVSNAEPGPEPKTKFDYVHISMPASRVVAFRKGLLHIATDNGVNVLEVGLWHGPELVSLVLSSRSNDPKKVAKRLWRASNLIIRRAQDLGGAMEYCHGVGMKLAHLMQREHGIGLEVMRKIKKAIDPLGVMNPGKEGL